MKSIISRRESLEILEHDLRRAEMQRRGAELGSATEQERAAILAEVEREVRRQIKRRALKVELKALLH